MHILNGRSGDAKRNRVEKFQNKIVCTTGDIHVFPLKIIFISPLMHKYLFHVGPDQYVISEGIKQIK
jgi:hypothetical protein